MREIGKIKWFGGKPQDGRNLQFGFIERKNGDDLFVHKNNLIGRKDSYIKGEYVSFQVTINENNNKLNAVNVKLLNDEDDLEVIEYCAESNDYNLIECVKYKYLKSLKINDAISYIETKIINLSQDYYKILLANSLPFDLYISDNIRYYVKIDEYFTIIIYLIDKYPNLHDKLMEEFILKLSKVDDYYKYNIIKKLPKDFVIKNKSIRILMKYQDRIEYLNNIVLEGANLQDSNEIKDEILELLKNNGKDNRGWSFVSDKLLIEKLFWDNAPVYNKLQYLLENLNHDELTLNNPILNNIYNLLLNLSSNESLSLIYWLPFPEDLKLLDIFFSFLHGKDQLLKMWEKIINIDIHKWNLLKREAKILSIYKATNENINISSYSENEKDTLILLLLEILLAKFVDIDKEKLFLKFHNDFQQYIVDRAWDLEKEIDLNCLLPKCDFNHVKYCEGRPWPTQTDIVNNTLTRVFCPRTGKGCPIDKARIKPNLNIDWKDWSLMEFFENIKINTLVSGISSGNEYIPRLSGWVNRLYEIRERLKCSVCNAVMKPNLEYAKNLARYNITIVSCSKGYGHDQNIYLNHCWACRNIIDSRESRIQLEHYYLCINCGSGPQQSKTYRQGDICPKCGGKGTLIYNQNNDKEMVCGLCNHIITLPASNKITGSNFDADSF